jgi:hypothetical protein
MLNNLLTTRPHAGVPKYKAALPWILSLNVHTLPFQVLPQTTHAHSTSARTHSYSSCTTSLTFSWSCMRRNSLPYTPLCAAGLSICNARPNGHQGTCFCPSYSPALLRRDWFACILFEVLHVGLECVHSCNHDCPNGAAIASGASVALQIVFFFVPVFPQPPTQRDAEFAPPTSGTVNHLWCSERILVLQAALNSRHP